MKMKSLKAQFIGAIAMVLVAAIAMGSSTYAWFAMNTQVTAGGMTVTAKSEGGIVITNADHNNWNASANAKYASATLVPTSTSNATAWYHNKSDDNADAKAHQSSNTYTQLNSQTGWKADGGVYFIDTDDDDTLDDTENGYYLVNTFYIKSSAEAVTTTNAATNPILYINSVTASGATNSTELDASLRVLIKIGSQTSGAMSSSQTFIYAPVAGATTSYYVAGSDTATAATDSTSNVNDTTTVAAIPANSTAFGDCVRADVYIYFEGEDAECKSDNIESTLDNLALSIVFGTQPIT